MKRTFTVAGSDRVTWAMCIAAYLVVADYFSPLCITGASLDEGYIERENVPGVSREEELFISIVSILGMYAALDPDAYQGIPVPVPEPLDDMIAELLQIRRMENDSEAVAVERKRLIQMASETLKANHMLHLYLAAKLMTKPLHTEEIEQMKIQIDEEYGRVA